MKTILIIIAVAVAVIQTVARAAEEPAWSLEGRSISADSCGVACPCNIGGPPDNGECRFIQMRQVDKGRYGDVKMDGVDLRRLACSLDEPAKFNFGAYYIDSGASAEQKEALRNLWAPVRGNDLHLLLGRAVAHLALPDLHNLERRFRSSRSVRSSQIGRGPDDDQHQGDTI
jgi:Protein of unknown function (DUF1326)